MTRVSIHGEKWLIDGIHTYKGITYQGITIEGLLLNARMVNAIFDDDNPYTRHIWKYPQTGTPSNLSARYLNTKNMD